MSEPSDEPSEALPGTTTDDPADPTDSPADPVDSPVEGLGHRAGSAVLSRRTLLGAGVVVVAGGIGAGIAVAQPRRKRTDNRLGAPAPLHAALGREVSLLAGLDAALHGTPAPSATSS